METIHFKAEGDVEFTGLIYIPKQPPGGTQIIDVVEGLAYPPLLPYSLPVDMMRLDYNTNLKLYIKRVFVTDDFKDLIPSYLNFLRVRWSCILVDLVL